MSSPFSDTKYWDMFIFSKSWVHTGDACTHKWDCAQGSWNDNPFIYSGKLLEPISDMILPKTI